MGLESWFVSASQRTSASRRSPRRLTLPDREARHRASAWRTASGGAMARDAGQPQRNAAISGWAVNPPADWRRCSVLRAASVSRPTPPAGQRTGNARPFAESVVRPGIASSALERRRVGKCPGPQEDSDAVARGGPRGRIRSQRRTRRRTAASTPASGSALGRPRSRWPAASASRAVSAWERPPASARIADLAAWRRVTRPGPARRLQPLLHTGAARAGRSMVDRWRSRARGRPPSQPSSC
jgi:hypothetical protein